VRPATSKDEEAVFVGQRGPLTESGVWRIVAKYADLAGLVDVSPHVLRHTFGRLVNSSLDEARHQGWASSPLRPREPNITGPVSFQRT
jgi:integrase